MIKNFCKRLVYKDFKPTLLSKILYEEVLSRNINLRMRLSWERLFYLYYVHRESGIPMNNNNTVPLFCLKFLVNN
jgi:hypothetical protein